MSPKPVIDMWAPLVPTREILEHMAEHFPEPMLGYLRIFWKQDPSLELVRKTAKEMLREDDEVLAEMDAAGVRRSMITGFDEASTGGTTFMTNEIVASLVERFPNRFIPFMGADVMRGMEAAREVETWILERHFKGLSLRPFMIGLPPSDRRYYPFYERCAEIGAPVSIHASANWTTSRPSDLGHPRHFDQVACDFPELKLILSHGGYPWVLEAVQLAWKHPNVHLEIAAHRPRYFATPGTGWEPLMCFGATTIKDKVLWGSGGFLLQRPLPELVAEMRALPLEEEILDLWMHGNAVRLLGLDD